MDADKEKDFLAMIAKARQKRERLLREGEEITQWLDKFDDFVDQVRGILGEKPGNIVSNKPKTKPAKGRSLAHGKNNPEKIKEILTTIDRPMKVRQILDLFIEKFGPLKGKNGPTIIRNTLSKKSQWFVQNPEDKTWGLIGRVYSQKQAHDAPDLFHG